jgi:hypothetical protein
LDGAKGTSTESTLFGFHRFAQVSWITAYAVGMWRNFREMTPKSLNNGHTTQFACAGVVRKGFAADRFGKMRMAHVTKPD